MGAFAGQGRQGRGRVGRWSAAGSAATNDAEALIALAPDCVVYAASGPERDAAAVPDYIRLLEAGINVVSTSSTSLVYPPSYFAPNWRDDLEAAAKSGGASLYVSGIFPGFASDQLALLMTTQSKNIRCITASEVALNDHYPVADVMMDGLGFGRPLDFEPMMTTPGFIEMAWKAPIYLMARGLGVEVEQVRGYFDREPTDRDISVAFGTIAAGTCGAVRTRAAGVVNGREAIVIEHVHPDGPRCCTVMAEIRLRRDLPGGHRRRSRRPLRDDDGGGRRPRRRARRDAVHGHAGGQCDSLCRRCRARPAQFAGHPDNPAAARI